MVVGQEVLADDGNKNVPAGEMRQDFIHNNTSEHQFLEEYWMERVGVNKSHNKITST